MMAALLRLLIIAAATTWGVHAAVIVTVLDTPGEADLLPLIGLPVGAFIVGAFFAFGGWPRWALFLIAVLLVGPMIAYAFAGLIVPEAWAEYIRLLRENLN
jgi:hypothetical protein